jgi:hypothetical protein
MKKIYLLILFFLPFVFGMGSLDGSDSADKIPVPKEKYSVTFVDQMNVITECKNASIQGETFIKGRKGDGTYTISFELIKDIYFLLQDRTIKGVVNLKSGDTIELVADGKQKAYGNTKYGTFQIKISDLKKIIVNK